MKRRILKTKDRIQNTEFIRCKSKQILSLTALYPNINDVHSAKIIDVVRSVPFKTVVRSVHATDCQNTLFMQPPATPKPQINAVRSVHATDTPNTLLMQPHITSKPQINVVRSVHATDPQLNIIHSLSTTAQKTPPKQQNYLRLLSQQPVFKNVLPSIASILRTVSACILFFIVFNTVIADDGYFIKIDVASSVDAVNKGLPLICYDRRDGDDAYPFFYTDGNVSCGISKSSECSISQHNMEWEDLFDNNIHMEDSNGSKKVNSRISVISHYFDDTEIELCFGETASDYTEFSISDDIKFQLYDEGEGWQRQCPESNKDYEVIWFEFKSYHITDFLNIFDSECLTSASNTTTFSFNDFNEVVTWVEDIYIQVLDAQNNLVNEINVGTSNASVEISYNDLTNGNPEYYYGKSLYFRTKFTLQNYSPYPSCTRNYITDKEEHRTYYKALPDFSVEGDSEHLFQACYPKVRVKVDVSDDIKNKLDDYQFNVKPCDAPEEKANIAKMELVTVNGGDYLQYKDTVDEKSLLFHNKALHPCGYLHIIQLTNSTADSSKYCAAEAPFCVETNDIPNPLTIQSINPTEYTYLSNTYHYTKYDDPNSCDVSLTLEDNGAQSRLGHFEYKPSSGGSWSNVPDYTEHSATDYSLTGFPQNNNYYVQAVDNDGCTSSIESTDSLLAPMNLTITEFSKTPPVCHPANTDHELDSLASIEIEWSGGIGPYTLEIQYIDENLDWHVLYTQDTIKSNDDNVSIPLLSPRDYYVIVIKDEYNSQASETFELSYPGEIRLSGTAHDFLCPGDFNTGSITYKLQGLGTDDTAVFYLKENLRNLTSLNDSMWTTGRGLSEGSYNIRVKNQQGCYDTVNGLVIDEPEPYSIHTKTHRIKEYGDTTGVIEYDIFGANGGYRHYLLYNNDTIVKEYSQNDNYGWITSLWPGDYTLFFKDQNNCWSDDTMFKIIQPQAPLTFAVDSVINIDCYGNQNGKVICQAEGGWPPYNYLINETYFTQDTIITGLSQGPGDIILFDDEGVMRNDSFYIEEPEPLTTMFTVHNLLCYHDSSGFVDFDISGGTPGYFVAADTSEWTPGDTLSGLAASSHQSLFVKDAHGCLTDTFAVITEPPELIIEMDSVKRSLCNRNDGAIYTHAKGGTDEYTYSWFYMDSAKHIAQNSSSADSLYSGLYSVVVMDGNACHDSVLIILPDSNGPRITDYAIDSVSCYGDSDGSVRVSGVQDGFPGYNYFLNGDSAGLNNMNLPAGEYHFRILDQKNCKFDTLFKIHQPLPLNITGNITSPTCYNFFDGSISVTVTGGNGGYQLQWDSGGTKNAIRNLNKGYYTVIVTDRKSCSAERSFRVIPPPAPEIGFRPDSAVLCTGSTKQLDGGSFSTYQWMKGDTAISSARRITLGETGIYVLNTWDSSGCFATDTFKLIVTDTPLDVLLFLQDSALIGETVEAIDVTWPVPDSIRWVTDAPVEYHDSNDWSYSFTSNRETRIRLTLRAWYGGCYSDSTKTIMFYRNDSVIPQKSLTSEPLITGFQAYPNPNTGTFFIRVKLSRTAGITLRLFGLEHSGADGLLDVKNRAGFDEYEVSYNIRHLNQGMYLMVLTAGNEKQTLKMIIE